jgi:hypothetical protein
MCKLSSRRHWRMVSRAIRTLVPWTSCLCRSRVLVKGSLTASNLRYLSCAGVVARCLLCPGRLTLDCETSNLYTSPGWKYPSPANVATLTYSSRLKLRKTWFIMTNTCDFLPIASKTLQIMIQFDQKG